MELAASELLVDFQPAHEAEGCVVERVRIRDIALRFAKPVAPGSLSAHERATPSPFMSAPLASVLGRASG